MGKSMFKRAILALMMMAAATCAQAAGTIAFSLSQQLDQLGNPLSGCLLYTIQAGTTSTPQNSYKDTALTLVQPNPLVCDAFGRLDQFFLADGQIKIRLTDKFGNAILTQDNILVIGPSAGGGGGGTVDPTTIAATGDVKVAYSTQTITGWVRMNGRTIGSATSGATERANADTQALFQYLWSTDSTLAVSGGRGASSIADWTANKTIAIPDLRGRVIAGLDGMGSALAGRIGSGAGSFGVNNNTLGFGGGSETHGLTLAQLPTGITSSGTNAISVTSSIKYVGNTFGNTGSSPGGGTQLTAADSGSGAVLNNVSSSGSNSVAVTSNNTSGAVHDTMSPAILMTFYVKL